MDCSFAASMLSNRDRPTLPTCDEHGRFLPNCGRVPAKRLATIIWHLAARGEAERLDEVLSTAARDGVDWSHRFASNGVGASPLFIASMLGFQECVRCLLSHRHLAGGVDMKDTFGNTALTAAASLGRVGCVRLLLQANADPNARNKSGCSPLDAALDFGRPECTSALLAAGARSAERTLPPRRKKGEPLQWERGRASQSWLQEPGLPGQSRRARELEAQLKKHRMVVPDTSLLETPLDRHAAAERKHRRQVAADNERFELMAQRSLRQQEFIESHRERFASTATLASSFRH